MDERRQASRVASLEHVANVFDAVNGKNLSVVNAMEVLLGVEIVSDFQGQGGRIQVMFVDDTTFIVKDTLVDNRTANMA